MIDRKSSKFIVLLSVLVICTCLPLIPQGAAAPDGYEPNYNFANATTLTKGVHSGLSIDPYWDVDYYKINLNTGDNMSVVLWNMTADLYLYLYDPSYSTISSSTNFGTTNETVTIAQAPTTGYYYLQIYTNGISWSNYTLNIMDVFDDSFEENDNFAAAPTLVKESYGNLFLADADYYNISLTAGNNLTAQVAFTGGSGYCDLILYAPNGTELQSMRHFYIYSLGNLVLRNAPVTGLYTVKLNPSHTYDYGNYSLLLADANDDIFEDNDGFTTAALLTKSGTSYGNLTLFDDDYYNVTLTANENISVYLTRTTGIGAFNMSLFSIDQTTELWYSNNIGSGHRVIAAHVPSSGAYTVRIRAVGNAWGNYSLSIGNLTDDAFEHNDSLAAATELTMDTTYLNLQLYDADVFKVFLTAGQNISFYFLATGGSFVAGTLNITLYAPDQATILFKVDNLELESYYTPYAWLFTPTISTTGFYYLQITPNQYSCLDYYKLTVGRAYDDRYEDNDIVGTAAELVKFTNYYFALFDDDFFKVSLAQGDSLRVLLTRSGGPGTFGVTIYGPDSLTILNSTANIEANGVGDARVMSVDKSGYYIIKVRSYTGAYGNYTLIIGNVYSTSAPGGIAGFPIEWVLLWGSGVLVVIFVWNRRKVMKYQRGGV